MSSFEQLPSENENRYKERVVGVETTDFARAKDWNELYAMIRRRGTLMGSGGHEYLTEELIRTVKMARLGAAFVEGVTRTDGLRDKVVVLRNKDWEILKDKEKEQQLMREVLLQELKNAELDEAENI